MTYPLSGVRVIELGVAIAGPLAARYLGHLGAEVLKVEARSRGAQLGLRAPPWAPADIGPAASDLMTGNNNFNAQKRGIGIELKTPEGRAILDELIARSDVFLTNYSVPAIRSLGVQYEQVRARNPGIVYISMAGYGSGEGPYREFRSWGPNLSSFAGLDYLTGDPDRPPVMTPSPLPDFIAGYHAAVAVQAALLQRRATGEGQRIDLSQFEAMVACLGPYVGLASAGGEEPARAGNRSPVCAPRGVFPARGNDAWVAITVQSDEQWRALAAVAEQATWAADPRFATAQARLAHEDELEAELAGWTAGRTAHEVAYRLQAAGVAAAPVQDAWGLASDPQLGARRYWRVVRHSFLARDLVGGFPAHFSETPARVAAAAPALGEANHELLTGLLEMPSEEVARLEASGALSPRAELPEEIAAAPPLDRPYWPWALPILGIDDNAAPPEVADAAPAPDRERPSGATAAPTAPLAGVRVIDLSGELGAYGTRLLADLGADVVRVEPPGGAAVRSAPPLRHDPDDGRDGVSFTQLHVDAGKRSVVLDLEDAEGRRRFEQLLATADILYEEGAPGALAASGFGWERLQALNPRLSLVQLTPFGQEGPFRDWRADELTLWAMSGMLRLTGYPDRRPLIPGARVAYSFVGAVGAVAASAALHARERIGRGQRVDVAAYEVLIAVGGVDVPAQLESPELARRRTGSRALVAAPYSYYQCRDRMICLLALMADHWNALAEWIHEETGSEGVLGEHLAVSTIQRADFNDEIEGYINALAGRYDAEPFCVEAQRRGIPAAPVNPISATLADPHLAAQGYWTDVAQPGVGVARWPGPPYRLSATPSSPQRPAPELGEHTEQVLGELAAAAAAR